MKYKLAISKMNQAMIKHGLTKTALAESVGVSPACITHWFKNTYNPSPKHIQKLANVLQLEVEELVSFVNEDM